MDADDNRRMAALRYGRRGTFSDITPIIPPPEFRIPPPPPYFGDCDAYDHSNASTRFPVVSYEVMSIAYANVCPPILLKISIPSSADPKSVIKEYIQDRRQIGKKGDAVVVGLGAIKGFYDRLPADKLGDDGGVQGFVNFESSRDGPNSDLVSDTDGGGGGGVSSNSGGASSGSVAGFWVTLILSSLLLASLVFALALTTYYFHKRSVRKQRNNSFPTSKLSTTIFGKYRNALSTTRYDDAQYFNDGELAKTLLTYRNEHCTILPVTKLFNEHKVKNKLISCGNADDFESETTDKFYYYDVQTYEDSRLTPHSHLIIDRCQPLYDSVIPKHEPQPSNVNNHQRRNIINSGHSGSLNLAIYHSFSTQQCSRKLPGLCHPVLAKDIDDFEINAAADSHPFHDTVCSGDMQNHYNPLKKVLSLSSTEMTEGQEHDAKGGLTPRLVNPRPRTKECHQSACSNSIHDLLSGVNEYDQHQQSHPSQQCVTEGNVTRDNSRYPFHSLYPQSFLESVYRTAGLSKPSTDFGEFRDIKNSCGGNRYSNNSNFHRVPSPKCNLGYNGRNELMKYQREYPTTFSIPACLSFDGARYASHIYHEISELEQNSMSPFYGVNNVEKI